MGNVAFIIDDWSLVTDDGSLCAGEPSHNDRSHDVLNRSLAYVDQRQRSATPTT